MPPDSRSPSSPGRVRSLLCRVLPLHYWHEVKEQCGMAGPVSELLEAGDHFFCRGQELHYTDVPKKYNGAGLIWYPKEQLILVQFLSQIMVFLINIVSSIFCGHLGKIELDSVTLAISVINVSGISVGIGLASVCDTLMSQTYGGKNLKRVGVILQRGILILLLCCFPCWALFINTEQVLLLCRQNPDVVRLTQTYVMIFIPALPAAFLYQLQIRYLQNQGIIWPQVITGVIVNFINAAINAIFMYILKLGVVGSAWANTISQFAMFGVLFIYIKWKKLHLSTWDGWSRDCLQEWGSFIRLAIPSMLMLCIEFWSFEIGAFLAGLISVVQLGAQAVMLEVSTAAYMIPVGFSVAASVRIGNALGAGDVEQAKISYKVSILCIVFCAVLTGSLLVGLKDVLAYVFTTDREIIALISHLMLIFAPFHLCDAIAGTCSGVLRGSGKQKIGAIINAIGFYLVGLPIGISLMFAVKLGVVGLWSGMIVSVFLQASFLVIYILNMNWEKACQEAQVRAGVKKEDKEPRISQMETSSTGFGMVANGNIHSCDAGYQDITVGAAILPDVPLNENHSEHLVLHEYPSQTSSIGSEVLSTKQLILRRGLAVCIAVFVLLAGVLIKIFTGNG